MLKALVSITFKENFSLKRLFGFSLKENKLKALLIAVAIVYGIGAMLFGVGFLFFDLGALLKDVGQTHVLLNFLYLYLFALTAIMALIQANHYLFQYKDYSFLGHLPLRPRTIMSAKTLVLLTILYVSNFFIALPIAFSYFFHAGFDILALVMMIVGFLTIPLLPLTLLSFVSLLIARFTASLRYKNIINIILMVALFVGYLILTLTSVGDVDTNPLLGQADTLRGLALFYWPMGWFSNAIANHSVLDIVYLSASHIILFVGFLLLVSKVAIKTNQLAQVTVSGKSKQQYRVVSQTSFVTLIKKEARKFLASPLYALNSGIGIVIMLLFAIIGLFSKEAIGSFLPLLEGEGMSPSLIIIIFIGFCIAMTYTPAISLSLEGKNIWIIKSLPLRANTIMWAKITFNLLLGVPAGLVALILFGISLSVSPFELGALLLFVPSLGFLISTSDAIINLLFPKIEFSNEAEVIKQSVAALFAIFGGFAIIAINGFGFYFLATLIHPALAILSITLFNALLGFMCLLWINRFSERYLKRI